MVEDLLSYTPMLSPPLTSPLAALAAHDAPAAPEPSVTVPREQASLMSAEELSARSDFGRTIRPGPVAVEPAAIGSAPEAVEPAGDDQLKSALTAIQAAEEQAEAPIEVEPELAARVEAARREAEAAHARQVTELEAHAAEQVEAAVRDARAEMTSAMAEATQQHDAVLGAVRAELKRADARQVEQVELEQRLTAFRAEADLAQAELERLHAEQADAAEPIPIAEAWPGLNLETPATPVGRRGMLWIASAGVLGCLAGSFVGWYVAVAWSV